jgi:mannose-1-phosphate guanylyltransferase
MAHVGEVARAVERHPDRVVLLGAQPTSPEGEYGWIEPGSTIDGQAELVSTVRQFWRSPRTPSCSSA